ncbi:hypothetical protein PMIN01_04874 [Paraphaeosphaeria minitans]|uniref:Uncharacterized protein n=1 Tax=Paraphaeosphaeria minitans TaxID=565426 RepID=A0A9P6KSC7_9PLEO|nr:hypothetical protein PMIN01_04874 [Paraphaeosphaeria minitans]
MWASFVHGTDFENDSDCESDTDIACDHEHPPPQHQRDYKTFRSIYVVVSGHGLRPQSARDAQVSCWVKSEEENCSVGEEYPSRDTSIF